MPGRRVVLRVLLIVAIGGFLIFLSKDVLIPWMNGEAFVSRDPETAVPLGPNADEQMPRGQRLVRLVCNEFERFRLKRELLRQPSARTRETLEIIRSLGSESFESSLTLIGERDPAEAFQMADELGLLTDLFWSREQVVTFNFLSHPRTAKIIEEGARLDPDVVAELIGSRLKSDFTLYRDYYSLRMQAYDCGNDPECRDAIKPVGQLTVLDLVEPEATEVHTRLMGLMFVAGQLKLTQLDPVVREIVSEAVRQQAYWHEREPKKSNSKMLTKFGLYNRIVLASAIIGTSADPKMRAQAREVFSDRPHRLYITPFDALVSVLERESADWTRGAILVEVVNFDESSDEDFDRLLEFYRQD